MRRTVAFERRTTIGPSRPPANRPRASGAAAPQWTGPNTAKPTAAAALATPSTTFLNALLRASDSPVATSISASTITPAAAPK